MPFYHRIVSPKYIKRGITENGSKESLLLTTYNNHVLTNLMKQMSSLSEHAETIFGNISTISSDMSNRIKEIGQKIHDIEEITKSFDPLQAKIGNGFGSDKKLVYKAIVDRSRYFQVNNWYR